MLIRSKLFRPGGSHVELGKGKDIRRYHFKPVDPKDTKADDPQVEHIADITNADDVATLLAIKEGYEVHASELKKPAGAAAAKAADKAAAEAAAKAAAEAAAKGPSVAAVAAAAKNYGGMKKPDLIKLIGQRTGKPPHGTTPIAKLIAQLEKLDAAAGA